MRYGDIPILPQLFDLRKNKLRFENLPLTWQNIDRARDLRNQLVHGAKCDPLEQHGKKFIDILLAASEVISGTAESKGYSVFRIIKRREKRPVAVPSNNRQGDPA